MRDNCPNARLGEDQQPVKTRISQEPAEPCARKLSPLKANSAEMGGRSRLKLCSLGAVVHKIAGLHQIAGQAVNGTIGEFRVYGTDGSVNRKSLNTYYA
jgi:hypothetical protein